MQLFVIRDGMTIGGPIMAEDLVWLEDEKVVQEAVVGPDLSTTCDCSSFRYSLKLCDKKVGSNPDEILSLFVKNSTLEQRRSWRKNGCTLLQEAARNDYWRTVECLANLHDASVVDTWRPDDLPDVYGNYSAHMAAARGHYRMAAFLAATLPEKNYLKQNHKGENAIVLAAACLDRSWITPMAKEHFFDLLDVTPADALPEALLSSHRGKNVFETLVNVGSLFWLYAMMRILREKQRGEELLCLTDSNGRNVAHYLAMRRTDWENVACAPVDDRFQPLRSPSYNAILDACPETAFCQPDSTSKTPWQHATVSISTWIRPHILHAFLLRTPPDLLFDDHGGPNAGEILSQVCRHLLRFQTGILQEIVESLPPGSADKHASDGGVPLFAAVSLLQIPDCKRILVEHMTEEGLMCLRRGETFVHHFVNEMHSEFRYGCSGARDFVSFLESEVAARVSLRRLLTVRNYHGQTAAELAATYSWLGLAKDLDPSRFFGPKNAA